MKVLDVLARDRLLPLFTPEDGEDAKRRLEVLGAAGVGAVELTLRSPEAVGHFVSVRRTFSELLLGAGTVLDEETARAALDAGADFLVSPCPVPEVAAVCREAGVPYLPGAATAGEYWGAMQGGAAAVKVFPGEVLGPAFVRALRGPFPDARLVVTGGVVPTVGGVGTWLDAGALAVGLGSGLFALGETRWPGRVADLLAFARGRA